MSERCLSGASALTHPTKVTGHGAAVGWFKVNSQLMFLSHPTGIVFDGSAGR